MNSSEEAYQPTGKRKEAESDYIVVEDAGADAAQQSGELPLDANAEVGNGSEDESEAHAESEAQRLSRERDEYLDLARRTQADYENYRKRVMRQQAEESARRVQDLVVKLLPVLDAFSIAEMHLGGNADMDPDTKALLQSGSMLFDVLSAEGVERVDQVGVPFDPAVHEAIEHHVAERHAKGSGAQGHRAAVPHAKESHAKAQYAAGQVHQDESSEVEAPDNSGQSHDAAAVVTGVFRAGYRWRDKVLRPAMVKVEE